MALKITASVKDTNSTTVALTGDSDVLIRYKSSAKATMSLSGAVYSEDFCIIRNGEQTIYGTSGTFYNVESDYFEFSAEDDNGNVVEETVTAEMIPYFEPTCNMGTNRPDAAGNMVLNCSGEFFNGSFGDESNTLTAKCRYKAAGESYSSWIDMDVSTWGNEYAATVELSGLDYRTTYTFQIKVEDALSSATATETGVSSAPIFHWGFDDFVFEVPVQFNRGFDVIEYERNVDISSGLDVNINAKDDIYIEAGGVLNLEASEIRINGGNIFGEWEPTLYDDAVYSYDVQHGWYSRLGNVVTVGFYIKVDCNEGYEDVGVVIFGLPFEVAVSGSGGGICSGAYVAGGYNFQCFVADEGGYSITIRVQESDQTSDGNLSTSASGAYFRKNGGMLTLSGTISYTTND